MKQLLNVFLTVLFFNSALAQPVAKKEFTNPLLPSGADPWVIYHAGYYYYTNSMGDGLVLYQKHGRSEIGTKQNNLDSAA
jgi:hypothetical protein